MIIFDYRFEQKCLKHNMITKKRVHDKVLLIDEVWFGRKVL